METIGSAIWKPGMMCPRNPRPYVRYQQICTDQGIYTAKREQDQISDNNNNNNNNNNNDNNNNNISGGEAKGFT